MEIVIQENSKYGLVVSSRVIAKELGKEHSKVLRTLDEILEKPNMASLIIPSFYRTQGQKREYKEYLLTKDGFILYMFNIRGYQDFKLAYINRFNEMERELKKKDKLAYINRFNEMERELKKKEQLTISFNFDDFEKEIIQLRARANAIKRELLEKRFLLDEKIKYLDRTGLTDHMEVYRANGKVYTMQSL